MKVLLITDNYRPTKPSPLWVLIIYCSTLAQVFIYIYIYLFILSSRWWTEWFYDSRRLSSKQIVGSHRRLALFSWKSSSTDVEGQLTFKYRVGVNYKILLRSIVPLWLVFDDVWMLNVDPSYLSVPVRVRFWKQCRPRGINNIIRQMCWTMVRE